MTPKKPTPQLDLDALVAGVRKRDRASLGRAITLVESRRREHLQLAQELLARLLPFTGRAHRVGISGVPGVGKSTFIDALGSHLTASGHSVAVLAVDPSSTVSGGSILGDKTRMARLAVDPAAFIRPSPNAGSLGGVARKTRETMIVCEAAGYDVVLVETVGVGQSDTIVADMVDCFLLLMLAGAGDELQGIKRGVLELADLIAINKADGENRQRAELARREAETALHIMRGTSGPWHPPVLTCSAAKGEGIAALWEKVEEHRAALEAADLLVEKRRRQQIGWMWRVVEDHLMTIVRTAPEVTALLPTLEQDVLEGRMTPAAAAARLLAAVGLD